MLFKIMMRSSSKRLCATRYILDQTKASEKTETEDYAKYLETRRK